MYSVDVARRDVGPGIEERARKLARHKSELVGELDGLGPRTFEIIRKLCEPADGRRTYQHHGGRTSCGSAPTLLNDLDELANSCGDVGSIKFVLTLEVVQPQHDDHHIKRVVRQKRGKQEVAAVSKWLELIVEDRRPSVQPVLNNPPFGSELAT
jgi:hypothetical protein